ncbi:MAG: hypothetical protein EF812_02245 [Methanosarcinales archaeon]|nr:MAG: hypothetical protein EF812_02245 [Methanosarcinales archaeon]
MLKQRFVPDTSALTDVRAREKTGDQTFNVYISSILDTIAEARLRLGISCYIPYPSVYNEPLEFAKNDDCGEGICRWSEQLGLRFVDAKTFPLMLGKYLSKTREIK